MNKRTFIIGLSSFLMMFGTFSIELTYAQDSALRYGTGGACGGAYYQ